jgi:hypothetical protein
MKLARLQSANNTSKPSLKSRGNAEEYLSGSELLTLISNMEICSKYGMNTLTLGRGCLKTHLSKSGFIQTLREFRLYFGLREFLDLVRILSQDFYFQKDKPTQMK